MAREKQTQEGGGGEKGLGPELTGDEPNKKLLDLRESTGLQMRFLLSWNRL